MIDVAKIAFVLAVVLGGLSLLYAAMCVVTVVAWRRRRADPSGTDLPPVTVLKPLCGLEPELEENLRSFCQQAYPMVQLLFGARSGDDPALEVARRVAAEFPERDIEVLSGERALGANRKVNTLANLLPQARHDVLVIADSDIRVGPTYLREIVTPLHDASVGLVTCTYRGAPTGSFWSRFEALAIDEWVLPSVLASLALGSTDYCSGATMALRRDTLEAIGGFGALGPWLADDHELGARVCALGLRTVVSRYEVATTVHEPDFRALFAHELRWLRTIRTSQPLGHAFLFITYIVPMTLLALPFAPRHHWVLALPLLGLGLRVAVHHLVQYPVLSDARVPPRTLAGDRGAVWLIPPRELLSLGVWIASFAGLRVIWREGVMQVRSNGLLFGDDERTPA